MKRKPEKIVLVASLAITIVFLMSMVGVASGGKFLTLPYQKEGISITQGWRYDQPLNPDPKDRYKHEAIDYNLPGGTSVLAAADGVARSWSQYSGGYGYGEYVLIYHNNGYYTLYAHLESINPKIVRLSQSNTDTTKWTPISRGEEIGKSGQTGTTGGYHLHFEVTTGGYVVERKDPYDIRSTKDKYPPHGPMGQNHLWTTRIHPDGTLIKGPSDKIYQLQNGQKRHIASANVFNSWNFKWDHVKTVFQHELDQYPQGEKIVFPTVPRIGNKGFADGTLILYGNDLYVISNNQRRHIKNPEIRDILGYTWTPISVTYEEFYLHSQGEDITKENSVEYPFIPEIPPSKPSAVPNKYLSADLNCDNKVNLADHAILMSFWGKDPSGANSCQSPDINQDGKVNLADQSIMMSQWT